MNMPNPIHVNEWLLVAGALLVVLGMAVAVYRRRDVGALLIYGGVVEVGIMFLGLACGGAGTLGAWLVLVYQATARGLAWYTARIMAGPGRRLGFDELRGAGRRRPVTGVLFGFGLFASIGISTFMCPDGRLMILHTLREAGVMWPLPITACAALVMVWLTIHAARVVCLEGSTLTPDADVAATIPPNTPGQTAWILAVLLMLLGLAEHPVRYLLSAMLGIDLAAVPVLKDGWRWSALVPFAGAFAVWGLGRIKETARNSGAIVLGVASLVLIFAEPDLDALGRLFALIAAGIGLVVIVYSTAYIRSPRSDGYYFFLLLMQGAIIGLAESRNLGSFFMFWELMTWSSYFLVVHEATDEAFRAGTKYFVICAGGATFMLPGLVMLAGPGQELSFEAVAAATAGLDPTMLGLALVMILTGLAAKAGLVPLHSWLPEAHPVAPSSISAPLSGLLTKAGVYGAARIFFGLCGAGVLAAAGPRINGVSWPGALLMGLGALTVIWGEIQALRQDDIKRMLAYSTMAQVGSILMVLGMGTWIAATAAFTHMLNHAIIKDLLFLAAGGLILRAGSRKIKDLAGLGRAMPWTGTCMIIGLLAIMDMPPFAGFYGKLLMLQACIQAGQIWMAVLLGLAGLAGVIYGMRVLRQLLAPYEGPAVAEVPWAMRAPVLALAGLAVLFGLVPQWNAALVMPASDLLFGASARVPLLLPTVTQGAHWAALIAYAGAFVLWGLGATWRSETYRSGRNLLAVLLGLASLGLVFVDPGLDPMARLFALIVGGVGVLVILYSTAYIRPSSREPRYYFFLLLMQGALMGLVSAHGLGAFFIHWEIMTWSSYFLIVHEDTPEAFRAGSKYFIMCAGGAAFMLPGLVMLGGAGQDLSFQAVAAATAGLNPTLLILALLCITAGLAAKTGLVPLHSWLPAAHPVAPSSISAPLSGLLTKTGVYGAARIFLGLCGVGVLTAAAQGWGGLNWLGTLLTEMGIVTMVWGEIQALRQDDIKRLLAYSTMGQIGEIMLVFGLCSWLSTTAALSHVLNHAVMKNLLFLGAGGLVLRAGSRKLKDLAGLGRVMPWTGVCMLIGLLAIMGMPPFAAFNSKYLMLRACVEAGHVELAALLLLASLAGAVYYMRIIRELLLKPYAGPPVEELPWAMRLPLVALAGLAVLFGVAPQLNTNLVVPVADMLARAGRVAPQVLPSLHVSWPLYVLIPMVGALLPLLLKYDRRVAGMATALVLGAATVAAVLMGRGLDTFSYAFVVAVPLMGCLNMVYAVGYMEHSHMQWRFYTFFLFMVGGLMGVASSPDLFSFFMFWEIMSSWTLYFVIVHDEFPRAMREGYKYFFFNVLGACFLFLGVVIVTAAAGSPDFGAVRAALPTMPGWLSTLAVASMALGLGMKAAQLPLRIDIQMHPSTAPTPVSGYISSVLLKSALFGLVKLFFGMGGVGLVALAWHQAAIMEVLAWVGGVTIVLAALMAILQSDLKLVLIYSTVSQLGYMVVGVSLGTALGVAGGLLHLFNHMLFKDLLFLVAGALLVQTGKHSLDELGGIGRRMPVTLAVFAIGAMCVVGVPPSNGFTSKWIIYHALMEQGQVTLAILSLLGSVLTLAYFAKYLHTAFLGQPSPETEKVQEAPKVMLWPMVLLAAGCVVTSVFPGVFLLPVSKIVSEMGLGTLDVAPWGLVSGRGAWNATAVSVLTVVALGIGWLSLKALVGKIRLSPVHTSGALVAPGLTRMHSDNVYGVPGMMLRRFMALIMPTAKEEE